MDIQILRQSLCNCQLCTDGCALLKETGKEATLTDVTICDLPADALVIKMDKTKFNGFLLDKKEWGYNKHSDYLIVTGDKLVFVEMKSRKMVGRDLSDECINKFTSDDCTIKHADNIIEKLMQKNPFFNRRTQHFVLLYETTSISKTSTIIGGKPSPNNTPSSFRSIAVNNGATISFRRAI